MEISFTSFEVLGSPAVVVEHLRRLCAVIAEPDVTAIELERGVIASEEDRYGAGPLVGFPLSLRFGNRGPGLFGKPQLAAHRLDEETVRGWCRRWLHRGNAVLVLDGPPPDGLTLPLPDGPPPQHRLPPVQSLPTPAHVRTPFPGVLVASYGRWSAEVATGLHVLEDRLIRRLRRDAGLVYEIGVEVSHLPDGTAAVGLGIDAADEHVPTIAGHLVEALDELCAEGPTPDELERDRGQLRDLRDDEPECARLAVFEAAVEQLVGLAPSAARHEQVLAGLDAGRVARALREFRDAMVVSVPERVDPPALPALPDCPVPPVTGRVFARAMFGSSTERGARLIVGDTGVTLDFGRGTGVVTVPFSDVVGVGTEPGPKGAADELLVLHSGEGDRLILRARDWRAGPSAVETVRAALPAELFFAVPERMRVG